MPQTPISTPDHTASVTRLTLGITSARGETAAPSGCNPAFGGMCSCSAFEDE